MTTPPRGTRAADGAFEGEKVTPGLEDTEAAPLGNAPDLPPELAREDAEIARRARPGATSAADAEAPREMVEAHGDWAPGARRRRTTDRRARGASLRVGVAQRRTAQDGVRAAAGHSGIGSRRLGARERFHRAANGDSVHGCTATSPSSRFSRPRTQASTSTKDWITSACSARWSRIFAPARPCRAAARSRSRSSRTYCSSPSAATSARSARRSSRDAWNSTYPRTRSSDSI